MCDKRLINWLPEINNPAKQNCVYLREHGRGTQTKRKALNRTVLKAIRKKQEGFFYPNFQLSFHRIAETNHEMDCELQGKTDKNE